MGTRVWQVYVHNVCMMVNVWGGAGGGECVGVVGVVVNVWGGAGGGECVGVVGVVVNVWGWWEWW